MGESHRPHRKVQRVEEEEERPIGHAGKAQVKSFIEIKGRGGKRNREREEQREKERQIQRGEEEEEREIGGVSRFKETGDCLPCTQV